MALASKSRWGRRAADLYDTSYAKRYRACDDDLIDRGATLALAEWVREVCGRFDHAIDVLDLGCGTGRYFWALRGVRHLVGLDASEAMLAEARRPPHAERISSASVTLVHGDFLTYEFRPAQFDLVYSIGVLAEHTPLTRAVVDRVQGWLRPGGRFAFTTVHPLSASVPRTAGRRLGHRLLPLLPGKLGDGLHTRLMAGGLYADERWVVRQLTPEFEIETLEEFRSEVHLHTRCVALKSNV